MAKYAKGKAVKTLVKPPMINKGPKQKKQTKSKTGY